MNTVLSDQIASLPSMNRAELLAIWAKNFNHTPPAFLRKDLMVPILAYRIQEREFGDLSNAARKLMAPITACGKTFS
jgi:hypothetical protein